MKQFEILNRASAFIVKSRPHAKVSGSSLPLFTHPCLKHSMPYTLHNLPAGFSSRTSTMWSPQVMWSHRGNGRNIIPMSG
jgi:hypothetical protein